MAETVAHKTKNKAFLQEIERQRLNKPSSLAIDLRNKVAGECQPYLFGGITHHLDDRGYLLVKRAGVSLDMIGAFENRTPIFGVCLGHQSIVHHFGGNIVSAERLMHGKTSMVEHDGKTIFAGISQPPISNQWVVLAGTEIRSFLQHST